MAVVTREDRQPIRWPRLLARHALRAAEWILGVLVILIVPAATLLLPQFSFLTCLLALLWFLVGMDQVRDIALREVRRFWSGIALLLTQGLLVFTALVTCARVQNGAAVHDWFGKAGRPETLRLLPIQVQTFIATVLEVPKPRGPNAWSSWPVEIHAFDSYRYGVIVFFVLIHIRLHRNLVADFSRFSPQRLAGVIANVVLGVGAVFWGAQFALGAKDSADSPYLFVNSIRPWISLNDLLPENINLDRGEAPVYFVVGLYVVAALLMSIPWLAGFIGVGIRVFTLSALYIAFAVITVLLAAIEIGSCQTGGLLGYGTVLVALVVWARIKVQVGMPDLRLVPTADDATEICSPVDTEFFKEEHGTPKRHIVVCVEGGGIHAAARALLVLSHLNRKTGGSFWRHVSFASTVSGGSVGTAMFAALAHGFEGKPAEEIEKAAHLCARYDLLSTVLARMMLTEPIGLFWPSRRFDRGQGLVLSIRQTVENAAMFVIRTRSGAGGPRMKFRDLWHVGSRRQAFADRKARRLAVNRERSDVEKRLRKYLGNSVLNEPPSGPTLSLNATSAQSGDRFVLSRLKLLRARTLANHRARCCAAKGISVADGAGLSARFPIVTPYGLVKSGEDQYERLWDGGLFDNSGLKTAFDIIHELRDGEPRGSEHPILLLIIGNNVQPDKEPPFEQGAPMDGRGEFSWLAKAAAGTLLNQNEEAARTVLDFSKRFGVRVAQFYWSARPIQTPLGWYISGSRLEAIAWMHGLDRIYSMNKIKGVTPGEVETSMLRKTVHGSLLSDSDKEELDRIRAYNLEIIRRIEKFLGGAAEEFDDEGYWKDPATATQPLLPSGIKP